MRKINARMFGLARYQSCPIPDTDKDGINDEDDKCPTIPGLARYQGCPPTDTDNDGVPDEDDKCPTSPVRKENNGRPCCEGRSAETRGLCRCQHPVGDRPLRPEQILQGA